MKKSARKEHWEKIYRHRRPEEMSWFQESPETALSFLKKLGVKRSAAIIDVGGGDSRFVDHLVQAGYEDITVLDISATAIAKARERLGERSDQVKWIVSDITAFVPDRVYDCWYDRAAFHFLTDENDIEQYIEILCQSLKPGGHAIIGTFSEQGPDRCSGLFTRQYSAGSMPARFKKYFEKIECVRSVHHTPAGKFQDFIFCSFRKNVTACPEIIAVNESS